MKNNDSTIRFGNNSETDHQCTPTIEGDWVVFRCPQCPDYERRINSKTGEMKNKGTAGNPNKHHGFHIKPGFDTELYCPN